MAKKDETLLVLDGNALLHRAWHALPPLTTNDGTVVNAAYGFSMILEKLLESFEPEYMAVAWDLAAPTFRHEKYVAYKAHREKKEQELYDQIPIIQDVLDAWGVPSLSVEGYEADDILATLAKKASKKGIDTRIVTGDLDTLQLVDGRVTVVAFSKGISETRTYDEAAVRERFGIGPDQMVDYKALRGDPSDNIPGVAGIGEKTAARLICEYGSVEGILKALDAGGIDAKFAKKLEGQEGVIAESKELVQLVDTVPLKGFRLSQARVTEPDWDLILRMYRDLGFRTLLRKHGAKTPAPPQEARGAESEGGVRVVTGTELPQALKELGADGLGVLTVEQPEDLFGHTFSAVAVTDGAVTLVVRNPAPGDLSSVAAALAQAGSVVTHDLKALMHATDWKPHDGFFDVMIASYLLHSGSRQHDLATAAYEFLGEKLPALPETCSTESECRAFARTASVLPRMRERMRSALKEKDLEPVFDGIEMPLIPILHEMERTGVELDAKALQTLSKALKKRLDALTKRIHSLAGEEFNIQSPSQLAVVLFETLELPTKGIKKTKSGYSTAASELEKLRDEHAIVALVMEYRELAKLRSTYVETLPELVAADGRVHTTFNQTVTSTGRLSSSSPNLQNIPIKTGLGNEIRQAFVAGKGQRLIAADYSQIELRVAAIIAKDKPFIDAFNEGADIHRRTAAEILGLPEEEVTKEQRYAPKAINFGVLYGMGPKALAAQTGLSFSEAKEFIARYFEIHHAIRDYIDETKAKAHAEGYVTTLFGRRRELPEIESGVPMLVAAAERMAVNMPVQGTATGDIMKMAMIAVHGWLKKSGWPARLLLQVHDEIVLECKADAVDAVAKGVKELMEGVAEFEVPLAVDVEIGSSWGRMTHWAGRHEEE